MVSTEADYDHQIDEHVMLVCETSFTPRPELIRHVTPSIQWKLGRLRERGVKTDEH